MIRQIEIKLPPFKRGFHLITNIIEKNLPLLPEAGLLNVFIQHTSAGLAINENADPTARIDLEVFMDYLVPEDLSLYSHTMEGKDDMPAHIKSSLIGPSLTIPINDGRLNLGTWQGIYLCEFRNHGGGRRLVVTVYS
ncbi:MAG: secondary thiamine-phosphate synthase enzyme YjbQ [Bacteroidales bacterium]|nr:secondary thiamine-phosphate synthase enzyme YjbQ [Bacteroidales bacterium]